MAIRVLLVDDEEDFTEVLSERMMTRGLEVDTVDNGTDGIEMIKKKWYDAIVLDLAMPGMDGIETLREMLKENPDLQVILLTGRATIQKSVEAVKEGAVEFLEKPVDIETLISMITEAQKKKASLFEKRMEESVAGVMKKKGW
ncbi:MAG: response regulator [Candidatus Hatepunaea meridiana]|nr:response regulator [Candidatus Hatepunaea meridiana]